jgi:hypothetical protein
MQNILDDCANEIEHTLLVIFTLLLLSLTIRTSTASHSPRWTAAGGALTNCTRIIPKKCSTHKTALLDQSHTILLESFPIHLLPSLAAYARPAGGGCV